MKQRTALVAPGYIAVSMFLAGCAAEPQGGSEPIESEISPLTAEVVEVHGSNIVDLADVKDLSEYMQPPGSRYLMHKSCAHEVPNEANIRHRPDGKVDVSEAGKVMTYEPCRHAMVRRGSASSRSGQVPGTTNDGWNTWSEAVAPTGPTGHSWFSRIKGLWAVPADPSPSVFAQLTYLFNGLQSNSEIIQPVLQWGNNGSFGGGYWTFASWHVYYDNGGGAYYSPVKTTSTGHAIYGNTASTTCDSAGLCSWQITTRDITTDVGTTMSLTPGTTPNTIGEVFNRADQAVLEAYSVIYCSDYPPNGHTQFLGTDVYELSPDLIRNVSVYSSCSWSASTGDGMTCGQSATLTSDGAILYY